MFKEVRKFFAPQLTADLTSGLSIPEGIAVNSDTGAGTDLSYVFSCIGDPILDSDGKPFPLFQNVLDIANDAKDAKTVGKVISIATKSLLNNKQLNTYEQPLVYEQSMYLSSFKRAASDSTTVQDAIQACVNEVNSIYLPIVTDSNRIIFEIDAISARKLPLGEYTYENNVKLSPKKGIVYNASVNNETLNPITLKPMGIYDLTITVPESREVLAILFNDNTLRYFTRTYEKPPLTTIPSLVVSLQLTKNYQSVVQTVSIPVNRIFCCSVDEKKIDEISIAPATLGTILSSSAIDTIANNNLPIIGIVGLKPQVMDVYNGATLLIAEQEKNTVVIMPQGGGILSGWTYFPHKIRGVTTASVIEPFNKGTTETTFTYADSNDEELNLASRAGFSSSATTFSPVAGGTWSFLSDGTKFSFSPGGGSTFATQAGGGLETRVAALWNTSSLFNNSRINLLKVRFGWAGASSRAIPFAIDLNTGTLLPCTVNIYQFSTQTPGVVVDGDLNTGIGSLLASFLIPYTNVDNNGQSHPPPDPDGVVRGGWVFDMPLSALNNASGFTGIYVQLSGFNPLGAHNLGGGISSTMKAILIVNSDISSSTPTSFLSNFPADGSTRYEEREFLGYFVDKQQEFSIPVKNVKQVCNIQMSGSNGEVSFRPKCRTYNVEFPRLPFYINSTAKTTNGSTYVSGSYSAPFMSTGYSAKVGEFFSSRNSSTVTTRTKRLTLTFDRLSHWFHSMRLVDGKCKLQMHIQSYTSRSINKDGNVTVISNPSGFSLLTFGGEVQQINGGTIYKTLPRNMGLDKDGSGLVTETELGRDYIVEWDVTDFMVSLRATAGNNYGFIFRNENESQLFQLASSDPTITGGEISSTVEIFDELAPRIIFVQDADRSLIVKNGYKSASLPPLPVKVIVQ